MKKHIKLIVYIIIVISWDIMHNIFNINSMILPTFLEIIKSLYNNFLIILSNSLVTVTETVISIFITIIFSLFMIIIINEVKIIKEIILKLIYMFQMIPIIAIAPIFILWFGIGIYSKIILVVLYSSFIIIVNMLTSIHNIPSSYKHYMLTLTNSKYKLYKYLYFPMSYNSFFSSLKIVLTYSIGCTITAEYIGAKKGLGVLLNRAYSSYQTDLVFAIILVIIIITTILLKICEKAKATLRR